jgi:DNA-3-methyladenine glycosylase
LSGIKFNFAQFWFSAIKLLLEFFNRPAPDVAVDLLGKYLVRKVDGKLMVYMITETEGYEGKDDQASHAFKGRTRRTEVMFGEAGIFYLYLVYGMHIMLNVVTGKKDHPGAVLIRGLSGVNGPGRLTKILKIGVELNTMPALPRAGLWFEDRGEKVEKKEILKMMRVGVEYAGPDWSKKLWRFVYSDSK